VRLMNQPPVDLSGLSANTLKSKVLKCVDLFCGAGGTSTAIIEVANAFELHCQLTGVNHWPTAIATHRKNHPDAQLLCEDLHGSNPYRIFKEFELDAIWASPSCTTHSPARGGRPIDQDQDRATPWCVMRWLEACKPPYAFIENIASFVKWGPINSKGKVIKSRQGETFRAWVNAIRSLGYTVDWKVLCAADFGDPTTRERLFVCAVRGKRRIVWPNPTHSKDPESGDMFRPKLRNWVPARDIIDWSIPGKSIFNRERPLVDKTMKRVWAGFKKFALPKILARYGDAASVVQSKDGAFLVKLKGTGLANDPGEPLHTVQAGGLHHALVEPYLVQTSHTDVAGGGNSRTRAVDAPLPTVCGNRGDWAVAGATLGSPFIVPLDQPGERLTRKAMAYIVKYFKTGVAKSVDQPLDTVTCKHRFGLVQPELIEFNPETDGLPKEGQVYLQIEDRFFELELKWRMLEPQELASAQGFRKNYQFVGTKTAIVKQIGNAVPRRLARALVAAAFTQNPEAAQAILSWEENQLQRSVTKLEEIVAAA
jgi:DNA (cytosine-5)-methyltransferase 1